MKQETIKAASTTFNMIKLMRLRDHMVRLNDSTTKKEDLVRPNHPWGELAPVGFNMRTFYPLSCPDRSPHDCGTSCCIAGHMVLLDGRGVGELSIPGRAQEMLGLSDHEATLFYGTFRTLPEVIEVLNHMILHGTIPNKPLSIFWNMIFSAATEARAQARLHRKS